MNPLQSLIYRIKHGRAPSAAAARSGTDFSGRAAATADTKEDSRVTDNRIIAGRREFMGQFSNLAQGKRNWQIAAFVSLGLLAVVTVAYIQLASTTRITPYIVEVDELGQARAFGPAERLLLADDRLTTYQLSLFIRNIRSVYQDPLAQKEMIVQAYAFAEREAQEWLNSYFSDPEHDPRHVATRLSRRVEVKSVIRIPDSDSWKVSWIEIETPSGSTLQRRSAWEGYLTVRQTPPSSTATIHYNPLGLYVTAINWTRVSGGRS